MATKQRRLDRKSLPEQVADQIESELGSALPDGRLPGYRMLAERYDVSWGTVITSLKLLEERGVVSGSRAGRSRRVVGAKNTPSQKEGTLLILSDEMYASEQRYQIRVSTITRFWERERGTAKWEVADLSRYRRPERQLRKLIARHQAVALMLCVAPSAWIQAAVAIGIPTYLSGGETREFTQLAGTGYRLNQALAKAVRHLRDLGHERILVPSEPGRKEIRASLLDGMKTGFEEQLAGRLIEKWCPVFAELVPSVWQSYWKRTFERLNPTAVVLIHEPYVFSFYGFCASRRLIIPEDVSVIVLGYSETLKWFHPQPSMMAYPTARSISHFKGWVRSGFRTGGFKALPMGEADGASVAPPKN